MEAAIILMYVLSICSIGTGLITSVMAYVIEERGFILSNIITPASPISISIGIVFGVIGLCLVYSFMIPIIVIMSAIGYLVSIRYLPKFVEFLAPDERSEIANSFWFPYYATIIFSVSWPIICLGYAIYSISSMLHFSIETPNKAIKRKIEQINKEYNI